MFSCVEKSSLYRRNILGLACLVLVLAPLVRAQSPFDNFQQFSASVSGSPLRWNKLKIYRSGNWWRGEYIYENEIRLSSLKDGNGWVIRPLNWVTKPKECKRMTLLDASTYPFFAYSSSQMLVERVPAASSPAEEPEMIDGHSCKVNNYTAKTKDRAVTIKIKAWEAEDLKGFPVKVEIEPQSRAKFTISYSDIKLEPPNPKLFEQPPMCRAGIQGKKKAPAAPAKPPSQAPAKPKS